MSLINKQWSSISTELVQDPQNFELWQSLIEAAEWNEKRGINKSTSEEELNVLRTSYNSFFRNFHSNSNIGFDMLSGNLNWETHLLQNRFTYEG